MSITLGVSIASFNAQRRLAEVSRAQSDSFTRLSSGLRINKASDDPASLAVSSLLSADARVYTQGLRNLNDGISVLNVADGTVSELSNIIIRLSELAEQAANGVYSSAQRIALDTEAQALRNEFSRVTQSASFNGRALFSSSYGELRLQDGYGPDGSIASSLGGTIGTGSFGSSNNMSAGNGANEVKSGDLNGDGIQDLVVANNFAATVSIFIGTGGGAFNTATAYATGNNPHSVELADFNGDGKTDIVSADLGSDSLSVRLGDGSGGFGTRVSYAAGDGPASITVGDYDGDGISDLAVAERYSNTIGLFFGVGNGTFAARVSVASYNNPDSVATADFNSDGNLDLVSADVNSNVVSVYLGTGTGSFSARTSYANGAESYSVVVGDVNNDGRLDLVSSGRTNDEVSIFLGHGNGSFSSRTSVTVGDGSSSVDLGDFNGDGLLDIVSADTLGDTVSILLNQGAGTFNSRTSIAVGDFPDSVLASDISGDGVLDLVTANVLGNNISILTGATSFGIQPILPFSLRTANDAREALSIFDSKLQSLASQSTVIGSFQSRIGAAIGKTQTTTVNLHSAISQLQDVDVAEESARLVRTGVLKQAAAAVLAQANQIPATALLLLQGE